MTPERWQRVKSLFERALDQPAGARDAFIDAAGESPSVVAEVRRLLAGDAEAGSFLQGAAATEVYWNRRPQAGLWVISLVDSTETLFHAGGCYPAGWSPDGSSVYAYCGSDMLSVPAGGGVPHTVFTAPDHIASADVSPDGKKFVFSVAETKSDVWIVDNFDPAYRK